MSGKPNSIPPGDYGGNLDIHYLTAGATLYLPVQVPGAMFFIADPHFMQGNGEVALTALEGSLRSTLRFTVLKAGDPAIPGSGKMTGPFAETPDYWIAIGLDPDLNEAMKKATREAVRFLSEKEGMDRAAAFAYLSAATDFEVSQVVDRTKGVHALIRRRTSAPLKLSAQLKQSARLKLRNNTDPHPLGVAKDGFYSCVLPTGWLSLQLRCAFTVDHSLAMMCRRMCRGWFRWARSDCYAICRQVLHPGAQCRDGFAG